MALRSSPVLILCCFLLLLALPRVVPAQHPLVRLSKVAHDAGHFNGTLLAVRNGHIVAQVQQGNANLQFSVPITAATRFPIASMTKLFTAILTLQLMERAQLQLDTPAATYLPELPPACRAITIRPYVRLTQRTHPSLSSSLYYAGICAALCAKGQHPESAGV